MIFGKIIEQRIDDLSAEHPTIMECFDYLKQCEQAAVVPDVLDDKTVLDKLKIAVSPTHSLTLIRLLTDLIIRRQVICSNVELTRSPK